MANSIFIWPGNITFSGTITFSGDVSVGGALTVTGNATAARFLAGTDTAALPGFSWAASPTYGMFKGGGSFVEMSLNGTSVFGFSNGGSGTFHLATAAAIGWSGTSNPEGAVQTSLASPAAGKLTLTGTTPMLQVGGTTSGFPAWKQSGAIMAARLADDSTYATVDVGGLRFQGTATLTGSAGIIYSTSAPTIASGGCTSPAVTWNNGTATFLITIGSSCTGVKTFTLTMPAATNRWACDGANNTSDAAQQTNYIVFRGTSTTAVVGTSYDRVTGLQEDFTAADTYLIKCSGG